MSATVVGKRSLQLRVLVADDQEIIARTLAAVLALAGYEMCAIYGGAATARILARFQPLLTVTNISRPGSRGVPVSSLARLRAPRFRILLMSGGGSEQHPLFAEAGREGLPFDLLSLPLRSSALLRRLRKLLGSAEPALLVPLEVSSNIQ